MGRIEVILVICTHLLAASYAMILYAKQLPDGSTNRFADQANFDAAVARMTGRPVSEDAAAKTAAWGAFKAAMDTNNRQKTGVWDRKQNCYQNRKFQCVFNLLDAEAAYRDAYNAAKAAAALAAANAVKARAAAASAQDKSNADKEVARAKEALRNATAEAAKAKTFSDATSGYVSAVPSGHDDLATMMKGYVDSLNEVTTQTAASKDLAAQALATAITAAKQVPVDIAGAKRAADSAVKAAAAATAVRASAEKALSDANTLHQNLMDTGLYKDDLS